MDARPTDGYIWLGTAVRFLRDAEEGWSVHGSGWVVSNINDLERGLIEYKMHVTRRVAVLLIHFRDQCIAELASALASDKNSDLAETRVLTKEEAWNIRKEASDVQTTMIAEAEGQRAFITRDKRFAVEHLLDGVENLMPSGVFASLSKVARYDFTEAGRCIAFEVPTAAAFHLMRMTEGVLRDFYCRIVKRERVDPLLWGPMTNHLRKRRDTPDQVLMNNLDNLRRSFRNPTQHPEKVYDIDEAQDLMSLSIDVVSRMHRHLEDIGK